MPRLPASAAALLAALLFGLSTPLAKSLLATVPPHLLGGLFYLGSGLGLTLLALLRTSSNVEPPARFSRAETRWLAAAVLAGGILAPPLQLVGVERAPASTASLLLNLESAFTALLAWIVFRERVTGRSAAGMALIVAGGVVLTWTGTFEWHGLSGSLAIAAACLFWGLDNNFTQKVSGHPAARIAAIKGLVAGVVNTALALAAGARLPPAGPLAAALVLGFLCYGLSLVLFVLALRGLGAARTAAYFAVAPFVGALAGVLFWHEPFGARLLAATALMIAGVWLHLTEPPPVP